MKVEKLKKDALDKYCKGLGIETKAIKKAELINADYIYQRAEIDAAINSGNCLNLLGVCRTYINIKTITYKQIILL